MSFTARWRGAGVVLASLVAGCNDDTPTEPFAGGQVGAACTRDGKAFIDADGDGYAASPEGAVDCVSAGAYPPYGYTGVLGDCDDSNPELTTFYLVDADGDGFSPSAELTVCGPSSGAPVGAVANSADWDCDDADPTRVRWGRRDSDQDGFGVGSAECLGAEIPLGYVDTSKSTPSPNELLDCDDERADVHPYAMELWSDLLDTDCDGYLSIPEGCLNASCSLPVEVDLGCSSGDLVVVEFERTSSGCEVSSWVVVVANQGSAAVPSLSIRVDDGQDSMSIDVAESLEPGARRGYKLWSSLEGGSVTASVSSTLVDCQPANNQRRFVDLIGSFCRI